MFVLFSETVHQNRRNGARGGRAFARNLRLRKLLAPPPPPLAASDEETTETAHEASLLLDHHFPWLAGAFARKQKHHRLLPAAEPVSRALPTPEPSTLPTV